MTVNFRLEQNPGGHPRYVYREKGVEIGIYYGEPPQKPAGVWIAVRVPGSTIARGFLARALEQFDAAELAAVAAQWFDVSVT